MADDRKDMGPGKAVIDGEVQFLSVTGIQKFDPTEPGGCNRAWWFRYVRGLKEPTSKALEFGKALAVELEIYLKTGVDALSPRARAGKHLLPAPGADLEVEEPLGDIRAAIFARRRGDLVDSVQGLAGLTAAGIPLMGAADLRHCRGAYIDEQGELRREQGCGVVEVIDHKALDVDTPMLTIVGWKTMGTLEVGDYVFAPDGSPTRVTSVSKICSRPTWCVEFDDYVSLIADEDHLWTVIERTLGNRWKNRIVKTTELTTRMATLHSGAIDSPYVELPIDPYVMGAWLGDGSKNSPRLHYSEKNGGCEVPNEFERRGYHAGNDKACKGRINVRYADYPRLGIELKKAGYLGLRSIPDVYLTSSKTQRADLLRGLLDTDGCARKRGQIVFATIHKNFAGCVLLLARSLGYRTTVGEYRASIKGVDKGPVFQVRWEGWGPTFGMQRKQARIKRDKPSLQTSRRWVRSVYPTRNISKVRCIAVDHPTHCYVAGRGFIVTHNTTSRINTHVSSKGNVYGGWAKTGDEVARTTQMVGYGVHAAGRYPGVQWVRLSHVYYQRENKPDAAKRTSLVPVETLLRRWDRVESVARSIVDVARETDVSKIEPNLASCRAFRRDCPYWGECPRTAQQILNAHTSPPSPKVVEQKYDRKDDTMSSILTKKATSAPSPVAGSVTGSTSPPAADSAEYRAAVEAAKNEIHQEDSSLPVTGSAAPRVGAINPPEKPSDSEDAADPVPPEVVATLPSPARERAEALSGAAPAADRDEPEDAGAGGRCPQGKQRIVLTVKQVAERKVLCACGKELGVKPAQAGDHYEATVPGHNRPKSSGDTVNPDAIDDDPEVAALQVALNKKRAEKEALVKLAAEKVANEKAAAESAARETSVFSDQTIHTVGVTIYVDCAVIGSPQPQSLSAYYDPLLKLMMDESIKAGYTVLDVRSAGEGPLAFGRWRGILAGLAKARTIPPGEYLASSMNDFDEIVVQTLRVRTVVAVRR